MRPPPTTTTMADSEGLLCHYRMMEELGAPLSRGVVLAR